MNQTNTRPKNVVTRIILVLFLTLASDTCPEAFGLEVYSEEPLSRKFAVVASEAQESSALQESDIALSDSNNAIPFQLGSGFLIVVEGRIGPLPPLKFILDTGTTHSMMDTKIAKKLSLPRQDGTVFNVDRFAKIEWMSVPELQVGPLKARNVLMMVGALNQFSQFADAIDGVIGLDLLRMSRGLRIDFGEKLITFRSAGESERLPNERVQALIVQLNVQGQSIRLVLDTGACELFLFEDRLRRQLPRLKLTNKLGQAHVGRLTGEMVTLPGIRLGTTELEAPAFLIGKAPDPLSADIDGYLGVSALNPAFIEFDFDANTLRIEPKASPASLMKIGPTQEAVLRQHHSF
jgi:predicted aspartyl protease